MDTASIASGFSGALQGLEKGIQNQYNIERQGQQDRLALQKYAEESAYKQQKMTMEKSQYELQMEQMKLQIKQLKDAQTQTKVYNAFNRYMVDGNTEGLNITLKDNPEISQLLRNTIRIEPLNPNNPQDVKLFTEAGGEVMDAPETLKRYVKTVDSSGNVKLEDMFGIAQGLGVYKTWDDTQRKIRHEEATIAELKAKAEYYKGRADGTGAGSVPFDIKTAEYEANLKMKIDEGTATPEETARYNALQAKRGGTGIAISNIASTGSQNELVAPPGPGFDISELQGRAKVETQKHIQTLELTPSGKDLNANMKKMYSEGVGASEGLTKSLAELVRNKNVTTDMATKFATEAKSYLPEELRDITDKDLNDVKFRQAFMTVSSVYLKLQSGLTVSDAERQDFLESMGSLKSNIKVNMSGLRNKFATIVDNYSANRVLHPELYDYKYSKAEQQMRQVLGDIDNFVKPTGKEVKPTELSPDKVKLGNSIFFGGN